MANPSPAVTVKDGAGTPQTTPPTATVTPGNTVTIALASNAGVRTWSVALVYGDETTDPTAIALTVDGVLKTATFTGFAGGKAVIGRSTVNSGLDANNRPDSTLTTTFKIATLTPGAQIVLCTNETFEHDVLHGYTGIYNAAVRAVSYAAKTVRAATTGALAANTRVGNVLTANANGTLAAQDGVTLAVGDRLLAKNEATGANKGIYDVTSVGSGGAPWVLTRSTDSDTSAKMPPAMLTLISEGSTLAAQSWELTTAGPIVLNTTSLTFTQAGGGGAPSGAAGGDLGSTYPNPTVTNLHFGSDARGDIAYRNATVWTRLAAATSGNYLQSGGAGADPSWATFPAALPPNGSASGDLGSSYPSPTVTNIHFGSDTQGDIAYRNATVWTRLPAGSSGNYLASGGAGANPSWVAFPAALPPNGSATGDLTGSYPSPTISKITLGSDAQGDIYYRNGSGVLARLAPTTNGDYLKSGGASANPSWTTFPAALPPNGSATGDLTGSYPAPTISKITLGSDAQGDIYYRNGSGVLARLAPTTNGDYLKSGGASANPSWTTFPAALPPNGSASGDLAGSYPSPTLSKITLGSDAQGDVYYRNGSGVLARLAPTTDGFVLTTHGAGQNPTWAAASGGAITTTSSFTQPAINATVVAAVSSSSGFLVGDILHIGAGGWYQVTALPDAVSVTVKNLDIQANAAAGATVASASVVTHSCIVAPRRTVLANAVLLYHLDDGHASPGVQPATVVNSGSSGAGDNMAATGTLFLATSTGASQLGYGGINLNSASATQYYSKSSSTTFGDTVTVSAIVRSRDIQTTQSTIFAMSGSNQPILLKFDSTGAPAVTFTTNLGAKTAVGPQVLTLGETYHIAGQFDPTLARVNLFVNGALVAVMGTAGATMNYGSGNSFYLFNTPTGSFPSTSGFNGIIEEVAVRTTLVDTDTLSIEAKRAFGRFPPGAIS